MQLRVEGSRGHVPTNPGTLGIAKNLVLKSISKIRLQLQCSRLTFAMASHSAISLSVPASHLNRELDNVLEGRFRLISVKEGTVSWLNGSGRFSGLASFCFISVLSFVTTLFWMGSSDL